MTLIEENIMLNRLEKLEQNIARVEGARAGAFALRPSTEGRAAAKNIRTKKWLKKKMPGN